MKFYSTSRECLILCLPYTITPFLSDFCWSKQVALRLFSLFLPLLLFLPFVFCVDLEYHIGGLVLFTHCLLISACLCFVLVLCTSKLRLFKDLLLLKQRAISPTRTHTNLYVMRVTIEYSSCFSLHYSKCNKHTD